MIGTFPEAITVGIIQHWYEENLLCYGFSSFSFIFLTTLYGSDFLSLPIVPSPSPTMGDMNLMSVSPFVSGPTSTSLTQDRGQGGLDGLVG